MIRFFVPPYDDNEHFKWKNPIHVSIPNIQSRGGMYLGRFDREIFREFSAGVSFGENSQSNCKAWARNYELLLAEAAKDGTQMDPDGWFEFKKDSKSFFTYIYIRPETPRRLPKYFDSFVCYGDNLAPSGDCTSSSCIGSHIGFIHKFSLRNNPRASWPQTMQRAEEVLRFVLPEIQDWAEGK